MIFILALLVSSSIFSGTVSARGYGPGDGKGQNYNDYSTGYDQSVEDQRWETDRLQRENDRRVESERRDRQADPNYNSSNQGSGFQHGH